MPSKGVPLPLIPPSEDKREKCERFIGQYWVTYLFIYKNLLLLYINPSYYIIFTTITMNMEGMQFIMNKAVLRK